MQTVSVEMYQEATFDLLTATDYVVNVKAIQVTQLRVEN